MKIALDDGAEIIVNMNIDTDLLTLSIFEISEDIYKLAEIISDLILWPADIYTHTENNQILH